MRKKQKLLLAMTLLGSGGFLLVGAVLGTKYNEAHRIKRVCPEARVWPSHRFGPIFHIWDFASIFVFGDFISPIDRADVTIQSAREPVDIGKLLQLRVNYVIILDSEIVNYDALLRDENLTISIMMRNPVFLEASPEDITNLDGEKSIDDVTLEEVYWFGNA